MYRFQVKAPTRQGEIIGITGSIAELGAWNPQKYVPLHTSGDRWRECQRTDWKAHKPVCTAAQP